jgi:hypothetical protein
MRTAVFTLCVTVLALAACGEAERDPTPILEKAVEALGGREALASVDSIYVRLEGHFVPPGETAAKAPYSEEFLLRLPDRLARRRVVAGLRTTSGVDGEVSWLRCGGAVADREGRDAVEDRADRDDLVCLLVLPVLEGDFKATATDEFVRVSRPGGPERQIFFDPETGLPARIVRETKDVHGNAGRLVRRFEDWGERGRLLFPSKLSARLGGSRLTLTVETFEINPGDSRGLSVVRPRDDRPFETGPIRRITIPGSGYFGVTHRGPLTDLAKVDLLLEQGLARDWVRRTGPNRRVFDTYAGKNGIAVVATLVPVRILGEGASGTLPRGIELANLADTEALAMKFSGPYPRDASLQRMLVNYGKDLGLEPAGAARYLLYSDPETESPAALSQEIRLPVRRSR